MKFHLKNQSVRAVERMQAVLFRSVDVDVYSQVAASFGDAQRSINLPKAAFGFDANVLLRWRGRRADTAKDYFSTKHEPPIIIPSQALTEFWNHGYSQLNTHSKNLSTKLDEIRDLVSKVDHTIEFEKTKIFEAIEDFKVQHEYMLDGEGRNHISTIFGSLGSRAETRAAPRDGFLRLAAHRHQTKTPPGFKDGGDGDFFVWVDFLYNLLMTDRHYEDVVFVTNEKKKDWIQNGRAHPVLLAEMKSLTGASLHILDFNEMTNMVDRYLQNGDENQEQADA